MVAGNTWEPWRNGRAKPEGGAPAFALLTHRATE